MADDLYVRAYKGSTSPWYRGTHSQHAGHIRAGGVDKDVTFEEADGDTALNDQIDAAYLRKYRGHSPSSLGPMVTATARTATIKLLPR